MTLTDTGMDTSTGTSMGTSTGTSSSSKYSTMMGGKRRRHKVGCKCLRCKKRRTMKSRKMHGGKRTRRHRRNKL